MSAGNDNNNHVMPNESEEEKLPDSLDPKARPEAEAAREELFKQNILMDVDERPEGTEAQEPIEAQREVEEADENSREDDSAKDEADLAAASAAEAIEADRDDAERIASEPVAGLAGPAADTTSQPQNSGVDPRQQEELSQTGGGQSAFINLSVDQQIEDALAQQPPTTDPETTDPGTPDPGSNQDPVASDSNALTNEDNSFAGQLIASDPDVGDVLTFSLASAPAQGSVVVNADGSYSFDPGNDFNNLAVNEFREVTFTYQVQDNNGASDTADMVIRVTGANDGPVAIADLGNTNEDVSTLIDVTANDFDPDTSDSFNVINANIVSGNGSIGIFGNSLLYIPHPSYNSLGEGEQTTVEIEYTIQDSQGAIGTSTATVTVSGTNDGIEVVQDVDNTANVVSEAAVDGDTVGITALAVDPDASDSVTYSLSNDAGGRFSIDPNSGEIVVANASLIDFETATSHVVTVVATSSDGSSSTENFTINISDANESGASPVIDTDSAANTASESAVVGTSVGVIAFSDDPDAGDSVTYSLSVNPNNAFAIDATTGEVTVADPSGLDFESSQTMQIEVTATSTDGSSSNATFAINVNDVNEGATVTTSAASGDEDTAIALDVQLSDAEPGATITVTIGNVPGGATLSAGTDNGDGSWTLDQSELTGLTITPPLHSDADFTLSVATDVTEHGVTHSYNNSIDVTVDAVVDAPNLSVIDANSMQQVFESTFEVGIGDGSTIFVSSAGGWEAGSEAIEIRHEGQHPGDAADGDQFIELNQATNFDDASIVQRTISTEEGNPYELSFQTSPRPGDEQYSDFMVQAIDVNTGNVLKTLQVDWDGNTVSELTWQTHSFNFIGTGGDVQLVFTDIGTMNVNGRGALIDDIQLSESSGFAAGDNIDLSSLINASLVDNDGSETITIELSGLPDGAVLSSGGTTISISGGSAEVSASQLSSLTLNLGDSFTGSLDIGVTATSTETSTGASASVSDTLSLTVFENNDPAPTGLNFVGNSNLQTTSAGGVDLIAAGSVVGSVSEVINTADGESYTFSLTDDAGGLFSIDSNTGEIRVNGGSQGFVQQTGSNNPMNGIDVGSDARVTFADIDNDGDLDALVGEEAGNMNYFENTGSSTNPNFVQQTGSNNPLNGVDIGIDARPTFVDMDGDGDQDVVVGDNDGNLDYFENTGTASNPSYSQQTGSNNPFNGVDVGGDANPTFEDIDNDGDLDAIVGENDGNINYFENTGSATNPNYVQQTGSNNPFNGIDIGSDANPAFADIDGDGDLDMVVGEDAGNLNYFENTGDAANPSYTQQTGSNNPFDGVDVGTDSTPEFADIDGDGDMDMFVGEENGNINYFENESGGVNVSAIDGQSVTVMVTDSSGNTYSENVSFQMGSNGSETISGTSGTDIVYGFDGDDVLDGGTGDDVLVGGDGNDIFIFEQGDGADVIDGGAGNSWTDTISIEYDIAGATDPASPWQIEVNGEMVDYDIDAGLLELGADVSGVIQFDDGTQLSFDNIENIEW